MREKVISLHRSQFMNFFLIFLESFFWVRRGETVLFRRFETRLRQVLLFKKSICVYLSQSKSAKQIFKTSTTNSGLSLILLSQDSTFITSLELKKRVCGWFTTCFKSVWCGCFFYFSIQLNKLGSQIVIICLGKERFFWSKKLLIWFGTNPIKFFTPWGKNPP